MQGKKEGRFALVVLGTLLLLELPEGRPAFLRCFQYWLCTHASAFSTSVVSARFSSAWLLADLSSRKGLSRFFVGFNTGIALEVSILSASSSASTVISATWLFAGSSPRFLSFRSGFPPAPPPPPHPLQDPCPHRPLHLRFAFHLQHQGEQMLSA